MVATEKKSTSAKTTRKAPTGPKTNIKIGEMVKVSKEMPTNLGKGNKYNFLATMQVGECICLPVGSVNVSNDILARALQGAARRYKVKIVTAVDAEGMNIWRKE